MTTGEFSTVIDANIQNVSYVPDTEDSVVSENASHTAADAYAAAAAHAAADSGSPNKNFSETAGIKDVADVTTYYYAADAQDEAVTAYYCTGYKERLISADLSGTPGVSYTTETSYSGDTNVPNVAETSGNVANTSGLEDLQDVDIATYYYTTNVVDEADAIASAGTNYTVDVQYATGTEYAQVPEYPTDTPYGTSVIYSTGNASASNAGASAGINALGTSNANGVVVEAFYISSKQSGTSYAADVSYTAGPTEGLNVEVATVPVKSASELNLDPDNVKFVTTNRGTVVLSICGVKYYKHSDRPPNVRWLCSKNSFNGCKVTVYTLGARVVSIKGEHTHPTE